MFKKITSVSLFVCSLFCIITCSGNNDNSEKDKEPEQATEEITEKEKMLWFDAEANFELFSKKENITYYLDKTKSAGFNKIVVDVRPIHGDVLYQSDFMPVLKEVKGIRVERDWDYLQFFIDEARRRDLKVTVSATIFTGGSPIRQEGMVYRDNSWNGKTSIEYTKDKGFMDIRRDRSKVSAFLNPVLPEVREFCLKFIKEIVTKYDFDAFALDYCRFPDEENDFSEASRLAFEQYIGAKVEKFPDDIFKWHTEGYMVPGKWYQQWWEFRAMIIHDFIKQVRTEINIIKPDVRLEYWAASWYGALYTKGQNWASKKYDTHKDYPAWASEGYKNAGFADLLDVFLCGTYLTNIFGKNDPESIEYGLERANKIVKGDCKVYGTLYAATQNTAKTIEDAVHLCLSETEGLMVFDIVQVIQYDLWEGIKTGISRAENEKK
ncbi:MAG: family 10 glycosylhydrolase [Bacteroidales bacterium]|nr:family 10 glycosylhydrolase [Bacteroidales bacterium]